MSRPIRNLADILAPVSPEAFFAGHFRQKPLHIRGTPDKLADVMSWPTLSGLVSQAGIWTAQSLELALDGRRIEAADYCRPGIDRDGRQNMLVDLDRLGALLRRGASLVLNDIASLTPGLKAAAAALEDGVDGKAQANLYCSWQAHQGFGSHFDTHDVYALHVAGTKTWRIYERHFEDPIAHPAFRSLKADFHEAHKGRLTLEVTLHPGDILYIPRGWYHDALATSEATIHVAFGVTPVIGLDLVTMLFERAVEDPLFRRPVPGPATAGEAAFVSHLESLGDRLAEMTRDPALLEKFRSFVAGWRYPRGRLSLPDDVVVRRWRVRSASLKVMQVKGGWHLADGRKAVAIPAGMARPVAWIVDRGRFKEQEFADAFPDLAAAARSRLLSDLEAMKVVEPD